MRCLLLLSVLAAARGATISSSVSTTGSSDGRQTTFASHRVSNTDPVVLLSNRASFGARQPVSAFSSQPVSTFSSQPVLSNRFNSQGAVAGGGLFAAQAELNNAAGRLAAVNSHLNG